jgi:hypothetical protein
LLLLLLALSPGPPAPRAYAPARAMAAFIEPVIAKLAEQARYWQAYADACDFRQGELPLSSWQAPAVRTRPGTTARRGGRTDGGLSSVKRVGLCRPRASPPGRPVRLQRAVPRQRAGRPARRDDAWRGAPGWAGRRARRWPHPRF